MLKIIHRFSKNYNCHRQDEYECLGVFGALYGAKIDSAVSQSGRCTLPLSLFK
jgi:hypothetical protein